MATGIAPTTPWYRSRGGITLLVLVGVALLALMIWAPWARNRAPQPETAQTTAPVQQAQQAAAPATPQSPTAPAATTQAATVPVQSVPAGFMLVADPAGNPLLVASPAPAAAPPAPAIPLTTATPTTSDRAIVPGNPPIHLVRRPSGNGHETILMGAGQGTTSTAAYQAGILPVGPNAVAINATENGPNWWLIAGLGLLALLGFVLLARGNRGPAQATDINKQGDGQRAFLAGEGEGEQAFFQEDVRADGTRSTTFRGRKRLAQEFAGNRDGGSPLGDRLAEKGFDALTRLAERTGAPTVTSAPATTGPQAPATAAQVQGVKKGVDGVSTRLAALEKQFAGQPA